MSLTGPPHLKGKRFEVAHNHDKSRLTWSKCEGESVLHIVDQVSLTSTNKTASGEFAVDDATFALKHQMAVQWRTCKNSKLVVGSKGT
jgi:hypothetical protein